MKVCWHRLLHVDLTASVAGDLEEDWVVVGRRGLPVVCACHHWTAVEN